MLGEAILMLVLAAPGGGAVGVDLDADGAEAGAAAGDEAQDNRKKARLLGFDVRPESLQLSSSTQFDENGEVRDTSHSFRIQFRATFGDEITYVGHENAQVTSAVTDTGEELSTDDGNRRHHHHTVHHHGRNRRHFSFSSQLEAPPADAGRLTKVTGTVDVRYTTGRNKEATIGPVEEMEGKRIRIDGLEEEVHVNISRQEEGSDLRIEYPSGIRGRLTEFRLLDGRGNRIETHGWSGGSSGATAYRTFRDVDMPDDGKVVLEFLTDVQTLTVPFTIENLPLPRPDARPEPEVTVQAVIPGEGGAGEGGDNAEQLPVSVEADEG